jgi:RNA polymerase primary sigma factor
MSSSQEPKTSEEPAVRSSLRKLAPSAKLPRSTVLGALAPLEQARLKRVLSETAECVFDGSFQSASAEESFLAGPPADGSKVPRRNLDNDDSGVDLLSDSSRALSAEQERHIFLRLNYCRYRVMRVLRRFRDRRLTAVATRELLKWYGAVLETRSDIVRANVPLVLAMAKRTKITGVDFADLISEGNLALLRSVAKFDCSRGYKFSTYACRAILKSFSRVAIRAARYRGRFPTEFDPTLEKSDHVEQKRRVVEDDCVDELKSILGDNLAQLNDVEQCVIRARFALDGDRAADEPPKAKTLEQVGEMIGVTKERVRQIQNKALIKLKTALEEGVLAV